MESKEVKFSSQEIEDLNEILSEYVGDDMEKFEGLKKKIGKDRLALATLFLEAYDYFSRNLFFLPPSLFF